ncbi:methionyl-tRNA formyltransferase [Prochlorococcus sp. AH-716-K03]|nr:methionyl-tRNA formyltransferase [Prochlorococcus sp. AH-716-K03]
MRIIFWGTPEYSVKSLEVLKNSDHDIVAVVSQPDKKRSRGNKLIPSPVKEYAVKKGIPVFTPEIIKGNFQFISKLKELSCDLFIVIAYGKILPKVLLDIPKYKSWNAHASLLPRWRGAAPIQWSILEGDEFTGVGIMKMEEGLDTGDVLVEKQIRIENDENLNTLTRKLSYLSSELFLKAISEIEKNKKGDINRLLKRQTDFKRELKYARLINKSDYIINWENTSTNIYRKINALYPRASTTFKKKNLKIIKIKILKTNEIHNNQYKFLNKKFKPGFIIDLIENEGIVLSTKTDPILILEAKLEGKNISSQNQLIQQLNPVIGEKFSD